MGVGMMGHIGAIGADQVLVLPLIDSRTNGISMVQIGPKDRRHPFRWFVRLPNIEDAERFPCPFGYDRKSVRFDPVILYYDHPVPPRTSAVINRIVCGADVGKCAQTSIEQWIPTQETVHLPALPISIPSLAAGQILEFIGTSYWRKGPGKNRVDGWTKREAGPSAVENRTLSILCMFKMTWLPKETSKTRYQVMSGRVTDRAPIAPVADSAPTPLADLNPPDQTEPPTDE
jgi:hypothetical protein